MTLYAQRTPMQGKTEDQSSALYSSQIIGNSTQIGQIQVIKSNYYHKNYFL